MHRYKSLLVVFGLALLLARQASAVNLVFVPKLQRHKTTGDLLILLTLTNKEEAKVGAVSLELAELRIKGEYSSPETPLPFVIGDIEGKKEEQFSIRFNRRVGKKGDIGMLKLRATTEKEFVTGLYRVTLP